MVFFEPSAWGRGGEAQWLPHNNCVVIAPMIMKLVTRMKLDVFDTMVTKNFVISLLLRKYVVITLILADSKALMLDARNSYKIPSLI